MIHVISYQPSWAAAFSAESIRIQDAVGEVLVRMHHIGSTAIPLTRAKPVIDILVEVSALNALDQKSSKLVALGYEAKGEFGLPGRRYFQLDDAEGTRKYQVHAFESESPEVRRHVAFRDYMNAHPVAAEAYGALKVRLAGQSSGDMATYIAGKDAFVKEYQRLALAWASDLDNR